MNIRRRIAGIMATVLAVTAFPYNTLPVYAMENDINIGEVVISTDSDDVINGEMIIEEPTVEISERNSYSEGQNIVLVEEQQEIVRDEDEIISEYEETDTYETELEPDEDLIYACGTYKDVSWTIYQNGKFTLSGTGDFVSEVGLVPWYYCNKDKIITAEIKLKGSTNLFGLFSGCHNLKSVDLSGLDSSSVCYMADMFSECYSLETIDLSNLDTSNVVNMASMFSWCSSLTDLNLSNFDTSKVEDMSYMFVNCKKLRGINDLSFNTSNVKKMQHMFYGCRSLSSLDLSHFDTRNVEQIEYMFFGCNSLKSLDVSGFNTSSVNSMVYMFAGCEELEELNVSSFNTSNVERMSNMFIGCKKLSYLNLRGFNTSKVRRMDNMFKDCNGLKSLDLTSFDTSNVTIMDSMFYNCINLATLNVSSFDTSNVTDMDNMFTNCGDLKFLDVSSFNTVNTYHMWGMFANCNKLEGLDLHSFSILSNNNIANNQSGGCLLNDCASLSYIKSPKELQCDIILPGLGWKNRTTGESVTTIPAGTVSGTVFIRGNIKGTFSYYSNVSKVNYYSSNSEDFNRKYTYSYSDDWFWNDSHAYNHDLARMSIRVAMTAMDYGDGSVSENRKTDNIKSLMSDLGFNYSKDSICYPQPETNTIGSAIGFKTISKDGKPATLLLVAIRGGGYEKEWGGNFNVRNGYTLSNKTLVDHLGFNIAATEVLNRLDSFVKNNKQNFQNDVKVWFVGYSRAAATANIAAARVIERNPQFENINNCGIDTSKDVFAYCFECPQNTENRYAHDEKYSCIFNVVNPLDFVPRVAMNNSVMWQYTRYGITYSLPSFLANWNYKDYNDRMVDVYLNDMGIPTISPEYPYEEWLFQNLINKLADLTFSPDIYYEFYQNQFISIMQDTIGKTEQEKVNNSVQKLFDDQFLCVDYNLQRIPQIKSKLELLGEDAKFVHFQELCLAWMDSISEEDLKKAKYSRFGYTNCPVDVTIKDSTGKVVGKIIDDTPVEIEDGIFTIVDDDGQKVFAVPGDAEFSVEFTATGEGEMTYSVVEKQEGYDSTKRVVTYSDIPIEKGDELVASVGSVPENEKTLYSLIKDNEEIEPTMDQGSDKVEFYTVEVNTIGDGKVEGSGTYTYGQFDRLIAQPNENARFLGWDVDGMIVSTDTEYRLEVTKDTVVSAVFTDKDTDKFYVGFDPQGGAPVKSLTDVAKGSTIKLPDTTRKGYELEGWYTEKDGKGNRFTEESAVNDNIVLYAYWKSKRVKGDVTGDGYVAMSDVVKTARAVAGNLKLTDEEKEAADVTGDNTVAMDDVVKEARYVAGAITEL